MQQLQKKVSLIIKIVVLKSNKNKQRLRKYSKQWVYRRCNVPGCQLLPKYDMISHLMEEKNEEHIAR